MKFLQHRFLPSGWLVLSLGACGESTEPAVCDLIESVELSPSSVPAFATPGGTVTLTASAVDACGDQVAVADLQWTSLTPVVATVDGGLVTGRGAGSSTVVVTSGNVADSVTVRVISHSAGATFTQVGFALADAVPRTTDLWLHGDIALTGSGCLNDPCAGYPVLVWDVANASQPVLVDSIPTDAASVNDVKISADGTFAVASREFGGSGITLIDLTDPAGVSVAATFGDGLESGVHNVWIERIGGVDYVFAAVEARSAEGGVHIIDVSDLANPFEVARFYGGSSWVHDVYVRDGLAFLSHWDAGLVIVDVGNGIAGGSPTNPVEVSRITDLGGQTHNAWYWPSTGYVFVGEEDGLTPGEPADSVGRVHIIDASDLAAPAEVATYTLGGEPSPHNFWLDETREILFAAWYTLGIRAIDVSGTLNGELAGQGRELAAISPEPPVGAVVDITIFWAPQLHNGLIYASDFSGLWVFEFVLGTSPGK